MNKQITNEESQGNDQEKDNSQLTGQQPESPLGQTSRDHVDCNLIWLLERESGISKAVGLHVQISRLAHKTRQHRMERTVLIHCDSTMARRPSPGAG